MKQNKTLTLIAVLSTSLILTACGGGSSGDASSGDTTLPQAKIDASNQKEVTALLFDSVDITTPKLPTLGTASAESESPLAKILPNYKTLSATTSGEYSCSEGGSLSSSMDGSVSTIFYENCQEGGATINGTVTLSYDESSKEITYGMKDYSILTSSGEYSVEDTTYVVSASLIKYTVSGETTHNDTTLNFDDYSYALSLLENKVNISINGSLMTESLGNWITIKTNQAMQVSDNTCPTSGNIDIQGEDSTLNLTFLNDKRIEVRLDGTVIETYESCEALPKIVET